MTKAVFLKRLAVAVSEQRRLVDYLMDLRIRRAIVNATNAGIYIKDSVNVDLPDWDNPIVIAVHYLSAFSVNETPLLEGLATIEEAWEYFDRAQARQTTPTPSTGGV